jgi:hypothetical protein
MEDDRGFPCRSTSINDHHDLIIKLINAPEVIVDIELAQGDGTPNDLSVILERIEAWARMILTILTST